jgi:tetratricopeptide (TPR) repeat protein
LAKVIDFGIAKAIAQKLTDKTLFTEFQALLGTPAYMSPEQADLSSVDIDTRSDIYALGVLLYELLTGRTPFDTKELLAIGLEEMRRTICEKEPERPSTRLSKLAGQELSTTAQRRGLDAPRLLSQLRGDLLEILGQVLLDFGEPAKAEALHREALELRRKVLGNDHPDVARSLNNLGDVLRVQDGGPAEAEALHRLAWAIQTRLPRKQLEATETLHYLGWALERQDKYSQAEKAHRQALALRQELLGHENPEVAASLHEVGGALEHVRAGAGHPKEVSGRPSRRGSHTGSPGEAVRETRPAERSPDLLRPGAGGRGLHPQRIDVRRQAATAFRRFCLAGRQAVQGDRRRGARHLGLWLRLPDNSDRILGNGGIMADTGPAFHQRLGHDQTVERVFVVRRQRIEPQHVLQRDGQNNQPILLGT